MISILGGWTLVGNFSGLHPKTNSKYKIEDAYITRYYDLGAVITGYRGVNWKAFWDLYHIFKFTQIRWSCQNADGSKSVDITTAFTDKGQAVVKRFFQDTPAEACGSFYPLPADKSSLSKLCSHWKDGTLFAAGLQTKDDARLYYAPFYIPPGSSVGFYSFGFRGDNYYACDEPASTNVEKGAFWKIYVR